MFLELLGAYVKEGQIRLHLPDGQEKTIGAAAPPVDWFVRDDRAISRIGRDPEFELGETYMEGLWDTGEQGVEALLTLLMRNFLDYRRESASPLKRTATRLFQRANRIARSYRNVSHHYDLDEWVFRLFLDQGMFYSCAYFDRPNSSLEDAQQAKCRHIMRKLRLRPGQRVLDVGCGWGGLAVYLCRHADVEVTGLTLSREQLRVAESTVREQKLEGRVRFLLQDYREHEDRYDRIVSVGMFEHVGHQEYRAFFAKLRELMSPGGIALLHTIGSSQIPQPTNPWIRKHIFPGGYIPSLSEVSAAAESAPLLVSDVEVLRLHYAFTLAEWLKRFRASRAEVLQRMGERFYRMWEFYLASSEASFRTGGNVVFQIQLTLENDSVPLVRDYLYPSA